LKVRVLSIKRGLATGLIAWLTLILTPGLRTEPGDYQPARFWQVSFKLQIQGEYRASPSDPPAGNFFLETDWYGFLEEDGLDFIIYHLGSSQVRWLVTIRGEEGTMSVLSFSIPPPSFKLDYIEGKEEEITFYYSLEPKVINYSLQRQPGEINLVLPSIPWNQNQPEEIKLKRKVKGIRGISLPRKDLDQNEIKQAFSWQEENILSGSNLNSVFQKSSIKVTVELLGYDIKRNSGPGVKTVVNLLQPLPADMSVYLGGGNLTVTEKHLDRT
jgi:hypothetical protein